jgi:hypothetical protein
MAKTNKQIKRQVRTNSHAIEKNNTQINPPVNTQVRNKINSPVIRYGIGRRARTKAAAGSGSTIVCNLYDLNGVEQTTGDESGITVYCDIINTTDLNLAVPRLPNNFDITIELHPHNATEDRWRCTTAIFQKSKDCP